jgi:4-amino-4-deoxy-L-arabinose transferase-like glycosyltransferase
LAVSGPRRLDREDGAHSPDSLDIRTVSFVDRVRRPFTGWVIVLAAAVLPRLVVLLIERGNILTAYTEKSDTFASTFVSSGTFGFLPGHPSGSTQPLYAAFLIPIYWAFGRSWFAVGILQTAVAAATALLVYKIGSRFAPRAAALVAVVATLNPYLIWHDVHVNREILDQVVLAALVLAILVAVERSSPLATGAVGVLLGVSILGNTRLTALPFVIAAFVAWRGKWRPYLSAAMILAIAAVCVTPWVARNEVSIGCATLTTDGRALWKANNVNTYRTLAQGKWIDDVFQPKSFPPSAQDQARILHRRHVLIPVNECSQMHMFEHLTFTFWRNHPVEKLKLMGQATQLLWDPRVHETQGRPGRGTWQDTARSVVEPVYVIPLYVVAAVGLFFVPAAFAWVAGLLLAYNTAAAMLFAGTTRYRVPYDFLLVLLAGGAIERLLRSKRFGSEGRT